MYIIKTTARFDSAHFLKGYSGKCSNLHGHRWSIEAEIASESLIEQGGLNGMVADFSDVKHDLRAIANTFDHALIYEKDSLRTDTLSALQAEGFKLIELDYPPTAENLARCFYNLMKDKGYRMYRMTVYETPDNCAVYTE
ncbi:MAG: 6-carboxytetrahydropterin synthase QueD [Clostridia bacterium]|nr:6-carboxytetrahydropterin synthase QueD [Clostridia bacterium]